MNVGEIIRDMQRRYLHSYVFLKTEYDNDEVLCYIESISQNTKDYSFDQPATIGLVSSSFGKISVNLGSANQILNRFPKVGMFQHGKEALIYLRKTSRQYTRGVNDENSSIFDPSSRVYISRKKYTLSEDLLLSAFKKQTYSFLEAISLITDSNFISVALPNDFALFPPVDNNNTNYLLFHMDTPVALIQSNGKLMTTFNEPLASYASKYLLQH